MKLFKSTNLILLGILTASFSGCGSNIAKLDDTEAFSYIKKYEAENQQIKSIRQNIQMFTKWIQPNNKKEICELEMNFGSIDKTLNNNYKVFWDGECKNGKAEGLGRIFEISDTYEQTLLSIYSNGKISNVCIIEKKYENTSLMGECRGNELDLDFDFSILSINELGEISGTKNNFQKINDFRFINKDKPTYNVVTKIYDDFNQFYIEQKYGTYGNIDTPIMIMQTSPFSKKKEYQKLYPNYGYLLSEDFYGTYNDKDENHGYSIPEYKKGPIGIEFNNDKGIKTFQYPNSLINFYTNEYNSVKNSVGKANIAYNKAQIIKEKYINKICKDTVKIDFMDNNEYKAICNENEKIAQLKIKIDAKLAQIEQQKQVARQQQNQQRMIQAQEDQAFAAQMSADAQQRANFNQSLQNLNNNLQMQQLNNSLMMNNMMPKRYDVYVH